MTKTKVKKPSARKSLHLFTNIFDVKKRTDIHSVGDEKPKRIAIKSGCDLWTKKNGKVIQKLTNRANVGFING